MIDVTASNSVGYVLEPLPHGAVTLRPGTAQRRHALTRDWLLGLQPRNLLLHHLFEAGRWQCNERPTDIHWGWESPTSQVRGHFVGHWMAAMATLTATSGDPRCRGLLEHVVHELALCQRDNGGEWVFPLPEKYLHWIAQGRPVWAPMYICGKTLMGLLAAHRLTGNAEALEIVVNAARWFTRFTDPMSREQLDDLLDWETGGIQEVWADLYGLTGEQAHAELLERFDRRRLIDRLVAGEDVLTNQHANQTVPEILAAARAWEVTGDRRWRDAVDAYWRCAVTDRGAFATGGQTFGEFWTPPFALAARLGSSNQEHCVVFHLMRLAETLLRWTGEARYADYLERNRVNGLYAQQHPATGMVAYYLPLQAGSRKSWATPTETFSCCLATMAQAGTSHGLASFYESAAGLAIVDYEPAQARWSFGGTPVEVTVSSSDRLHLPGHAVFDAPLPTHRPHALTLEIEVAAAAPVDFELTLRLPWWLAGAPALRVDGEAVAIAHAPGTLQPLCRTWTHQRVTLELPRSLVAEPLPDDTSTVAFLDGPTVLAGLVGGRRTLTGAGENPAALLEPSGELELGEWRARYLTRGQPEDFAFVPLNEVTDEAYTVYFPVR